MSLVLQIEFPPTEIAAFCEQYAIRKLSIFGSALREDFRPDSDLDVLIEFDDGHEVTLFEMGAMQMEITSLMGRTVDLKTAAYLSPYFRQAVVDQAVVVYERPLIVFA